MKVIERTNVVKNWRHEIQCKACGTRYEITVGDVELVEAIGISGKTAAVHCPECTHEHSLSNDAFPFKSYLLRRKRRGLLEPSDKTALAIVVFVAVVLAGGYVSGKVFTWLFQGLFSSLGLL